MWHLEERQAGKHGRNWRERAGSHIPASQQIILDLFKVYGVWATGIKVKQTTYSTRTSSSSSTEHANSITSNIVLQQYCTAYDSMI